jgi:hypothetical protein
MGYRYSFAELITAPLRRRRGMEVYFLVFSALKYGHFTALCRKPSGWVGPRTDLEAVAKKRTNA